MSSSAVPAVLSHLARLENVAVDAAIVEAVVHLAPDVQQEALSILMKRGRAPNLAAVVGKFPQLAESTQKILLDRIRDASEAARIALSSANVQDREGAVELIRRSGSPQLAYLLAEAVRSHDPHTRDLAARALHSLTSRFLQASSNGSSADQGNAGELLANALRDAVNAWELHFHPKVLEATLWMSDRLFRAIEVKLDDTRSRIGHLLTGLIQTAADPRMADFLLRALTHTALRSAAADAIASADGKLLRALFQRSTLLAEPKILAALHYVQDCQWMQVGVFDVLDAADGCEPNAIRFVLATAGPVEHKLRFLADLLNSAGDAFVEAARAQIAALKTKEAEDLLAWLSARKQGNMSAQHAIVSSAPIVPKDGHQDSTTVPAKPVNAANVAGDFDVYWNGFDTLPPQTKRELERRLRQNPGDVVLALCARLRSKEPRDRLRAMQMTHALSLGVQLSDDMYALAHDPDPRARSYAMTILADIPGPTTERILLQAANDADERVQANAIQAMDTLGLARRVIVTEPKLESPNNRVRANAVKSLLRTELRKAGETLLAMLDDPTSAQRLSALWVISRLELRSMRSRVAAVADSDPDERVRKRAQRVADELAVDGTGRTVSGPSKAAPRPINP